MSETLEGMTAIQRLSLINQFKILSILAACADGERTYYGSKQDFDNAIEILENGYERHYKEVIGQSLDWSLTHPRDPGLCDFVIDVLNMYSALQPFFGYASDATFAMKAFRGFDGNEEAEYFSYASFVIQKMLRYKSLGAGDLNSHCPMVPTYRKMISAWKQSAKSYELSTEDYQRIQDSLSLK